MIIDNVLARIYGKKRGWCFSPKDFLDLGSASAIWKSLTRLEERGVIRKILRGIYDYPIENNFLAGFASPDPDKVAQTIARSLGWSIAPEGNTALNILGLSTQVPAHWQYLTDGKSNLYAWDGITIKFVHQTLKDLSGISYDALVVVQALKTLGQKNVTDETLKNLREKRTTAQWKKAVKECRYTTMWIYEIIKKLAAEVADV